MRFFYITMFITLLSGCLKPMPNDPNLLARFELNTENLIIRFETDKGTQTAYYLPPLVSPQSPPRKLAILYPGINSIALGWLNFIQQQEYPKTGYLLIEYPGRGDSEGVMQPEKIYQSSEAALAALAAHFGLSEFSAKLSLMGHSFGAGAALQFAVRHQVERIVLVSPYNSLKQAARQKSWLLSLIMPIQVDNRELIRNLLASKSPPTISILHGGKDTVLPFNMGKELASIAPDVIQFCAFPEDGHTDILTRRRGLIFSLLNTENNMAVPH